MMRLEYFERKQTPDIDGSPYYESMALFLKRIEAFLNGLEARGGVDRIQTTAPNENMIIVSWRENKAQ